MKLYATVRRHLAAKLFLTYATVVLLSGLVTLITAYAIVPLVFAHRASALSVQLGALAALEQDMLGSLRRVLAESVALAVLVSTVLAVLLSGYTSRRVVADIREMTRLGRRIASGHYAERVALVTTDVSEDALDELGRLGLTLNQMAATLERLESQRRRLIGDVAHELRAPLAAITGYTEGLLDGVLPAEPETYARIHREVQRLQRLVRDLQELSRIEEGAYRLDLTTLSIADQIRATAERLRPQFEDKAIGLHLDLPESLPLVRADPHRLDQILSNLLGNALQYTQEGQVRITAFAEGDMVRVSVTDTGIGISAQHLARVFERFFRVDGSRSRASGGTGIGLTIAKHLVEAHGGRLQASSAGLGKGSVFAFSLPVATEEPGDVAEVAVVVPSLERP
ncbi:MAG: sensor histidine kinase [Anaerolineae bacterium]